MRAALAVVQVGSNPVANMAAVLAFVNEAADRGAELVLFPEAVITGLINTDPDWLLFPFARCFAGGGTSQARWDAEEMPSYAARVRLAGVPALMVNYLADTVSLPEDQSFGGAFAVSPGGHLIAGKALGETGLLVVDLG